MRLHRLAFAVDRMFARRVKMKLLELEFAVVRRGEASRRGVGLDRVSIVGDTECLRLPGQGGRANFGLDGPGQVDRRLFAAEGASLIGRIMRAPTVNILVVPVRVLRPGGGGAKRT